MKNVHLELEDKHTVIDKSDVCQNLNSEKDETHPEDKDMCDTWLVGKYSELLSWAPSRHEVMNVLLHHSKKGPQAILSKKGQ